MQAVNSEPNALSRNLDVHNEGVAAHRRRRQRYIACGITAFACVLIATSTLATIGTRPEITSEAPIALATTEFKEQVMLPTAPQTNDVDAALITALKQQNHWQEDRLSALTQEVEAKNINFQEAKAQLNKQETLIQDLKISQAHLQDDIENGESQIQQLTQKINNQQSLVDAERQTKDSERLSLDSQLQNLRTQAEKDKQTLTAKVLQLEETGRQLTVALNTKTRLVAELEDKVDAQKHIDQNSQLAKQAQSDAAEKQRLQLSLSSLQLTLSSLQEKYNSEHNQLLAKEALFAQLSDSLRSQKEALLSLEEARQSLTAELSAAKQQYTEHLAQIGPKTKSADFAAKSVTVADSGGVKRIHQVNKGETLSAISQKYYGSAMKWNDIYEANKSVIPNKNQIKPGTELVIP